MNKLAEIEHAFAELPAEQLKELILEMVKNPALLEDGALANLASLLDQRNRLFECVDELTPRYRSEPTKADLGLGSCS